MSEEDRDISGLIFVALMFIGGGIGLMFGRPDVGGAIGMGIGFLAMAYMRARYREITPERTVIIGKGTGATILALIGIGSILAGLGLLFGIKLPIKTIGGLIAIVIGLAFLAAAFKIVKLNSS